MIESLPENVQQWIKFASEHGMEYLPKILTALAIFFIGKIIVNLIIKGFRKVAEKNNLDPELIGFLSSVIYWALFAMVIIAALGQIGVQTASFIALLGAAGLAIGLALQGSLSNFAAGVLIIMLRPFRIGDLIDVAGQLGKVEHIKVFVTELATADNKVVIIPNARVLDSNIINYSAKNTRRVDLVAGISYDDDIDQARTILTQILKADKRVLDDPEFTVAVSELADSSVNFVVRAWVKTDDYWDVYWALTEQIKKRFDEESISIPYPHTTIVR